MKLYKAVLGYCLIVVIYFSLLLMVDTQKGFFEYFSAATAELPVLMLFASLFFGLKYARWFLLLCWAGNKVPVWRGWLAYVAGFAFTATPGKVG
jgi:hypothetical protein